MTLMVHAPFSRVGLTRQPPPHLEDIVGDRPEKKLRTVNLSFCDPETEELEFNLDHQTTHAVQAKGKQYLISLDEIGEEETPYEPGRKYLYFTFNIEEI